MPVIQPGSRILVTGGNSYVGVGAIRALLERGFAVRATVRSKEKNLWLEDLFKEYKDKFELVVVEDIKKDGAFDEVVKGVDAIEHTASPVTFDLEDPDEIIEPAVKGTLGILKSALKTPAIKRIVVVGSIAGVASHPRPSGEPKKFTENDWNDESVRQVEQLGKEAMGADKYCASKTLSEKAAWAFYREHQRDVNWDMVAILPAYAFGLTSHPVSKPKDLNLSMRHFYEMVIGPESDRTEEANQLAALGYGGVDIKDVSEAMVKALTVPEASGERFIVCDLNFRWQDYRDVANQIASSAIPSRASGTANPLPVGEPGSGKKESYYVGFDGSKAARVLGLHYRGMEETVRDILAQCERRGW